MAQDRTRTFNKLDGLWRTPSIPVITVDAATRLAVLSDLHLGDGGDADDMRNNHDTLVAALDWYRNQGFTLVLLGDIEELWQFELDQVEKQYGSSVYAALCRFLSGRILRVFGNHDVEWRCPSDPATGHSVARGVPEAVKLADPSGTAFALLVHGHQGSTDSDRNAWISRFFVRGLWKTVEPLASALGLYRHPSATKSMVVHDYEHVMYAWAKERKRLLMCGHSHRAVCGSRPFSEDLKKRIEATRKKLKSARAAGHVEMFKLKLADLRRQLEDEEDKGRDIGPLDQDKALLPCYFNSGCGLYTDGATAIELEGDDLRLVKWGKKPAGERATLVEEKLSLVRTKVGC